MAIIKLGELVAGIRGTIGGTTYSANKSGPFAKGWSRGTNPRSSPQSNQRSVIAAFASSWRDLTQTQRDGWDTYAAAAAQDLENSLGETYSISGFNWYIRINSHLFQVDESARDAAPTLTRPTAAVIESLTFRETPAAGNSLVQYDLTDPDLTANHFVEGVVVRSEGIGQRAHNFTFLANDVPNVARRILLQDELEAAFGTIAIGMRLFISSSIQDAHGQRGPVDTANADAT
jgi:hypothetical protein